MKDIAREGMVLQVQDFSVHDGEGIRSTIFLAGCPLRCKWCSNPETWTTEGKLVVYDSECIECGTCREACPYGLYGPEVYKDRKVCSLCGECVDACPKKALEILNKKMTVEEIVRMVKRSEIFFRTSGGGVTFSGGEATVQEAFLRSLTEEFYNLGISMWIETCGYFDFDSCKDIFAKFDHVLFDIKHMDSDKHKFHTGVENEKILENAKAIYRMGIPVTVRIPLIKGVNSDEKNIRETALFIRENLKDSKVELLPYHNLGTMKYKALRFFEELHTFQTPDDNLIEECYLIFKKYGVERMDFYRTPPPPPPE